MLCPITNSIGKDVTDKEGRVNKMDTPSLLIKTIKLKSQFGTTAEESKSNNYNKDASIQGDLG